MAYPSGTPVDELILENVKTTLAAIATPSFHYTVASCERLQTDAVAQQIVVALPGIMVGAPEYVWSDKINPLYSATMQFVVRGVLAEIVQHQTSLSWFGADIRQALLADVTRGGYAVDTKILQQTPFMLDEGAPPFIAVDLLVQVRFRHLFTDPNTAR